MARAANTPALVALALSGALGAAALAVPTRPALACGWESSTACAGDRGDADEARWMLKRVVAAVQADESTALGEFAHGQAGFRTEDTYVFCVGPDGRVSAHPDSKLMGQDARALRDANGKLFAAEMLDRAKVGEVVEVDYLFPRPGRSRPVPKTSFVTRVKDQVCGVGYYDAAAPADDAPDAHDAPASRLAELRRRLDAAMPSDLRTDWTGFLHALDEQRGAQEAVVARARQSVEAAEAVLGGAGPATDR